MGDQNETKAPVRVRLVFADRNLLSKAQRSEGFLRSWVVIRPDLTTVAEFCRDITGQFGLNSTSTHELLLLMDGFRIPPFESTSIFKDNDEIRVEGDVMKTMKKGNKKKAVASPASVLQIKANELVGQQIVVSSNRIPLIYNSVEAIEKKQKKRKRSSEKTSSKREQKEEERSNYSKKTVPAVANASHATINESRKAVPAVATPSHFHVVNQKTNAPVLISERNQQVASIGKHTSTGFYDGPIKKNIHGGSGAGTQQSRPSHWMPGQARFMSPGAGPSNWQQNGPRKTFQGDRIKTKKTSRKPRSGFNGPNGHNRNWQPWENCNGPNAIDSQPQWGNSFATEEATEKIIPRGDEINEDKHDFESFYPLPRLPMEGDIIAFRLDIVDNLGCPGISSFRVGKVIVFDPVLMIIFLLPVPEFPTPDCEVSEYEKSMYKEDGSLEIGFEYLVDLRLIKESTVKTTPKMHKSGKGKNKSKASNRKDERNDNNVNSAWEASNTSNAEETTENNWGAWGPSTGRAGESGQNRVQYGTEFGSYDKFSNGWNGDGGNNNSTLANGEAPNSNQGTQGQQNGWDAWEPSTSRVGYANLTELLSSGWNGDGGANNSSLAWEANGKASASNSNQHTQALQNSWDAWEPSTSRAGSSWPHMRQHCSGFEIGSRYSRGGRQCRGGKYFNPKLKK